MIGSYRWYIQDQEVPENVKDTLGKYYEYGYLKCHNGWHNITETHNHTVRNVGADKVPVLKTPNGDRLVFRTLNDRVMLELCDREYKPKPLTLDVFDRMDTYGGTWLPWILYDDAFLPDEMQKISPEFRNLILESYYLGDYIRDLPISDPIDFELVDGSILRIENGHEREVNYGDEVVHYPSCGIFLDHEPTEDDEDQYERANNLLDLAKRPRYGKKS